MCIFIIIFFLHLFGNFIFSYCLYVLFFKHLCVFFFYIMFRFAPFTTCICFFISHHSNIDSKILTSTDNVYALITIKRSVGGKTIPKDF